MYDDFMMVQVTVTAAARDLPGHVTERLEVKGHPRVV
jgi:hypothetical protein